MLCVSHIALQLPITLYATLRDTRCNIATMFLLHWHHVSIATLLHHCHSISIAYCCAILLVTVCNIAIKTLPQCSCYSKIMWSLQHCCSSITILLMGILVQHCSNVTAYQPNCISAMLVQQWKASVCDNALTLIIMLCATLQQHCCFSDIMWGLQHCCCSVTILLIGISAQHCSNVAACQRNCASAMSPSNATTTGQNLVCSTLQVTVCNILLTTLPQCCCYIDVMGGLQHWCTVLECCQWKFLCNTAATLQHINQIAPQLCLPAMLVQHCKALCVQ